MYRISNIGSKSAEKHITDVSSIYFSSILTGNTDGIIWADKKENPNLLLIWSEYQEDFQLMGKPLDEKEWPAFYQWFKDTIVPFLKTKEINEFEYGTDNDNLSDMMQKIFTHKTFHYEKQKIFSFSGTPVTIPKPLGYCFEKINESFLQKNYCNISYITDEIKMAYGNYDNFLKKGYGYAAIKDNEIAARAIMTFKFHEKSNISVDTLENHRRKGLSSYLASMTVKQAINLHQNPIWDCSEDNTASEKTAIKCGFTAVREDKIYWFSI